MSTETELKVKVTEEPAWRRVLEIEVDAESVGREAKRLVDEYRKDLSLPGFRKGKVPAEMARKHLGEDLNHEVLRHMLPRALDRAVRENELRVIGDPEIRELEYRPGQPLTFKAVVEVVPVVEITGYEGLTLTRRQPPISDDQINEVLDNLREQNADLEEVDRPAQGSDVVTIRYYEVTEDGKAVEPGEDPTEVGLTMGGERTPEVFTNMLMGAKVGEMKTIPLEYPPDYQDPELAGSTKHLHTTVGKVEEKIWPAVDDAFAQKLLGNDEATAELLKSTIRKNMEAEAQAHSMKQMEDNLVRRLLELNTFDLPQGIVESTLDRILAQARQENPNLPPDEESRIREQYRQGVEHRYRRDILFAAVGRQEQIQVTDEDLDQEIASFAEKEGQPAAQLKARLRKEGSLERLREDLFNRRVLDRLVEKAEVSVVESGQDKETE